VFGIRNLVVLEFDTFFRRGFVTTQGIRVMRLEDANFSRMRHGYFWAMSGFGSCSSSFLLDAAESIKDEILPLFPRPNISGNTLVMSMRSGDIFAKTQQNGESNYGQPCCQYYLDAMERDKGHDNVLVVSEDSANPCLQLCLDRGAVFHPHTPWRDDLAILLWAERLVLSRSTFMRLAMYLSPVRKTWYHFGGLDIVDAGCGPVWYYLQPLGPHWHCIPSADYQKEVILDWNVNKTSRLLRDNCTWSWISHIDRKDHENVEIVHGRTGCWYH
jgi:hypothetical protein